MSKKQNAAPLDQVEEQLPIHPYRFVRKHITGGSTSISNDYEQPYGISETVPGQAPDLGLMLNRARSGQMIPHRDGVYHDQDLPDLYKMDDVELMQYRMDLADKMALYSQELHDASKALETKQAEMALQAAVEARLKDESKNSSGTPDPLN